MKKIIFKIILIFLIFSCDSSQPKIKLNENPDSIGIKISYRDFQELTNEICEKLKKNKSLEIDEMIKVVRIINTVEYRNRDNRCIPLIYTYYIQKSDLIESKLEVKKIADGYYSEKYDLFLNNDINYNINNNSRYFVIFN